MKELYFQTLYLHNVKEYLKIHFHYEIEISAHSMTLNIWLVEIIELLRQETIIAQMIFNNICVHS